MSEPVTNVETEDVLNSIRRLVSEDPETVRARKAQAVERFVLTPALRVGEQTEEKSKAHHDVLVLEIPCETAEDASLPASDAEEVGDTSSKSDPSVTEPDHQAVEVSKPSFRSWDAVASAESFTQEAEKAESKIVELEKAVNRTAQDWEPDGSEPGDDETPVYHIFATARNTPPITPAGENFEAVAPDKETSSAERVEIGQEPENSGKSETLNVHAYDGAEVLFKAKEAKPAEPVSDIRKKAMLEELAATVLRSKTDEAVTDNTEHVSPDADILPDEHLIDEDVLREMVAAIVREELQGLMGERITRNVRRMVRREIQRAMALKDFD